MWVRPVAGQPDRRSGLQPGNPTGGRVYRASGASTGEPAAPRNALGRASFRALRHRVRALGGGGEEVVLRGEGRRARGAGNREVAAAGRKDAGVFVVL